MELMRYGHFIFAVNRPDLLIQAVNSVKEIWDKVTIIDNSQDGYIGRMNWPVRILRSSVPLSCPQSMNLAQRLAEEKDLDVWAFQHSDVIAPPQTIPKYLDFVEKQKGQWATVFTSYDWIAAFNVKSVSEIGSWDTRFPQPNYHFDVDWYYRARNLGYTLIDSNVQMLHLGGGSNTIKEADQQSIYLAKKHMNLVYYGKKWGGPPHKEVFKHAWNIPTVKVFGLQRTGTNLISSLLRRNFSVDLLLERNTGWKHGKLQNNNNWPKSAKFILCAKNPFAWLVSCYNYFVRDFGADITIDKNFHPNMSFSEFLRSPSYEFSDPIDRYNQSYKGWLDSLPTEQTIIVRQEDQSDQATVLSKVGSRFNLRRITEQLVIENRSVDVDEEVKGPYTNKDYISKYSEADINFVKERLSLETLSRLGYNVY